MSNFNIEHVIRDSLDTVKVKVTMQVDLWKETDKKSLYGIDISNAVYRGYGVKASNPTVDSSARSLKGIKKN